MIPVAERRGGWFIPSTFRVRMSASLRIVAGGRERKMYRRKKRQFNDIIVSKFFIFFFCVGLRSVDNSTTLFILNVIEI